MERETGIEPATSSLGSWRSTAELLPHPADYPRLRGICQFMPFPFPDPTLFHFWNNFHLRVTSREDCDPLKLSHVLN